MTLNEAIIRLNESYATMVTNAPVECLAIANDIKALIALRIQTSGLNYEENPFPGYTPQHIKTRQKEGYQVEYVDFTMTGELWNNIQPYVRESNERYTIVDITAKRADLQKRLRGFVGKRGNILSLAQSEIDLLRQLNAQRVLKYFR